MNDVIIVGAGIAGACAANAIARRGANVMILEAAGDYAAKASGNRLALITPYIATKTSPLLALYSVGYAFSHSFLSSTEERSRLFNRCGALQLPSTQRLRSALQGTSTVFGAPVIQRLSAGDASLQGGVPINSAAFFIPDAGCIEPRALVEQQISEYPSQISVELNAGVAQLNYRSGLWELRCENGSVYSAPVVVLCNAANVSLLSISAWLPVEAIRGQTASLTPSKTSHQLRSVIAFGGYLTPVLDGAHFLGAHYRHDDLETEPRSEDTTSMLDRCVALLPELELQTAPTSAERVCFRTSTVDRLPYIGPLPDFQQMQREAASFRSGTDLSAKVPIVHHKGLFVHTGHGSRGLLSCPLGGELLARLINHEELCDLEQVLQIVTPDRLPYRML